jgi:hypothetical protein
MAKREQDAAGTRHSADVPHGDQDSHPFMVKRRCSLAGWRPRTAWTGLIFADSGWCAMFHTVASASRPCRRPSPTMVLYVLQSTYVAPPVAHRNMAAKSYPSIVLLCTERVFVLRDGGL